MTVLISLPILILLLILQTALVTQIPLLQGTADLILLALVAWSLQQHDRSAWTWGILGGLLVSYVSAAPFGVFLAGYLVAVTIANLLRLQISNVPLLAMYLATFLSTVIIHGLSYLVFRLANTPLNLLDSINQILLPSLLLNLILALPFFTIFGDLAKILHPQSLEI